MSWNKVHSKSLEEKVARLKDANHKLREQLKAKDEEIKELGEIVQQYLIPSKNYDAIIKAKDEEIKRLNNLYADTVKEVGKLDDAYSKIASDFESAVMEIEALKSRNCKDCKNFFRHDDIQNHGCLKGYSTHIVYGIPCVYADYSCIRHVPKE